jgi:DNA-binding transcriptional LysR family regulator
MKIRQVQYVLMVAEMGSFTDAAEELYISQSSLSKQIIALEKELGASLFDRSRRRIALTLAGEAFVRHARTLNEAYLAMMAELSEYKATPSFSILSIPVIAQYGIASYLAQFRIAYPHLDFTLEEREPLPILRSLNNHSHDLAFVRDNYLDAAVYSWLVIARDKLLVAVSKTHRLADRPSVSLSELAGESFITYEKSTLVDELVVNACRQAGFTPHIIYATLRTESILGLVASNSGIALVMGKVFDHSKHLDVVGVPLDETIKSNVVLAWLKNKKPSRATRTFVDFMSNRNGCGSHTVSHERSDPVRLSPSIQGVTK